MTQKILAAHAGLDKVIARQLINAKLDIVLGNDITTPVAVNEFKKAGFDKVFDKDRVAIVLDHFVPNKDIKAAEQSKTCREFACAHCVSHFYDVGKMGIEHALLPEQGVVTAGDCIIGEVSKVNDDHTDNFFLDPIARFADIEEDEPPIHLLCNEYAKFGICPIEQSNNSP